MDKSSIDYWKLRTAIHLINEEWGDAEAAILFGMAYDENNAWLWSYKALLFLMYGDTPYDDGSSRKSGDSILDFFMKSDEPKKPENNKDIANEAIERALAIDSQDAGSWFTKALIRNLLFDDDSEALAAIRRGLKLNPKCSYALGMQAALLLPNGLFVEGDFRDALALDPSDDFAWFYKGLGLLLIRKYRQGLEAIDRAAQCAPNIENDSQYWRLRIETLRKLGRNREAYKAEERLRALG